MTDVLIKRGRTSRDACTQRKSHVRTEQGGRHLQAKEKDLRRSQSLSVKAKTTKLLQGNIGGILHGTGLGNSFLDMKTIALVTKEKIGKVELYQKLKLPCIKGHYQQSEKTTQ